jgi:hypothetical protein
MAEAASILSSCTVSTPSHLNLLLRSEMATAVSSPDNPSPLTRHRPPLHHAPPLPPLLSRPMTEHRGRIAIAANSLGFSKLSQAIIIKNNNKSNEAQPSSQRREPNVSIPTPSHHEMSSACSFPPLPHRPPTISGSCLIAPPPVCCTILQKPSLVPLYPHPVIRSVAAQSPLLQTLTLATHTKAPKVCDISLSGPSCGRGKVGKDTWPPIF